MLQKSITLELACRLTDEELITIGKQMSDLELEIEGIENEKKRVAGLRKVVRDLSHKLNIGEDVRPVQCTVEYDQPTLGMKRIIRNDTQEVVMVQPMTDEELQVELALDKPNDGEGAVILPMNPNNEAGDEKV